MRCLVHACCGPCALESTRALAEEGRDIALVYDNPNIQPEEEYLHRLDVLKSFVAKPNGYALFEGTYDSDTWEREVGVYGRDRQNRCRACYRLRLTRSAELAAAEGFEALSTTLTISPYQFTDVVLEELRDAAEGQGLTALDMDFSGLYAQTTKKSRELGMYRQNYCGCRFSVDEAEEERAAAREARKRESDVRHRALVWMSAQGCVNQTSQL